MATRDVMIVLNHYIANIIVNYPEKVQSIKNLYLNTLNIYLFQQHEIIGTDNDLLTLNETILTQLKNCYYYLYEKNNNIYITYNNFKQSSQNILHNDYIILKNKIYVYINEISVIIKILERLNEL